MALRVSASDKIQKRRWYKYDTFDKSLCFKSAHENQFLTQLVITENHPSGCDPATDSLIHTGATSVGRDVPLQSDCPEAVMVPVLWILLAQMVGGDQLVNVKWKFKWKKNFHLEARGTSGPVSWKDRNKVEASPQWHSATWQQEVKIKAMWGNSCTQTPFYCGSFLSCV